jgi:nicotinamidase-related amidase
MTSAPIRDPLADHLITPQNAPLLLIDYQPAQVASVRSVDHDLLLNNAVSTVRTIKTFGVPVVHSTVNAGRFAVSRDGLEAIGRAEMVAKASISGPWRPGAAAGRAT